MLKVKAQQSIALVCTGSTNPKKNISEIAKDFLEKKYQVNVVYKADTYENLSYLERATIFLDYLFDEKIKLIWGLRGGEGTADLIPIIHQYKDRIKKSSPKILLGFSDFTPLLIYFSQEYNWSVVHGPGLSRFFDNNLNEKTKQITLNLLFGNNHNLVISNLKPLNDQAKKIKEYNTNISGGNLSLINISVKESWELQGKNKILIIEDVNEKPHVVSRTLKHLQRIGMFEGVEAIIFGDFNGNPIGKTLEEQSTNAKNLTKILNSFAQTCSMPVLYTNRIGHGKINDPIVFNKPVTLYTGKKGKLLINLTDDP